MKKNIKIFILLWCSTHTKKVKILTGRPEKKSKLIFDQKTFHPRKKLQKNVCPKEPTTQKDITKKKC